jgi:hypothetical protein
MPRLIQKRGTRAQIDAAAIANNLRNGEIYLITDEGRLTVGTAPGAHQPLARQGESGGDPWTWQKLQADVVNSTTNLAPVSGLSFIVQSETSYIVDIIGAFQSAAVTTGLAMALDIPSGTVIGHMTTVTTGTTAGVVEQIADNSTTNVTPATRTANQDTPFVARFHLLSGAIGGPVQVQFRSENAGIAITIRAALTLMGHRAI